LKSVCAIIKTLKRDDIREALSRIDLKGITVSDVKGYGRRKGHADLCPGAEYVVDFLPEIKVEIVLADEMVSKAVEAIKRAARTGEIGDGKIFVTDVGEAIRVPTGERGIEAV